MSNVSQWETSAPNNDAAPPDGAPEGMAANTVNDTMREMMAAVARWYQDTNGSLVTGGAGNAYTLSTNNNNSSLTDLPLVVFVANRANTGAATLNVDGLGAKSLRFGGVALEAGVLQEDVAYIAIYNAEDDAFDIVGYPTKDASEITTGELDDDRLSSNVPLKDAPNVFTRSGYAFGNAAIAIAANAPTFLMHETDQDEDGGLWAFSVASGQFRIGAVPDNFSGSIPASQRVLSSNRSGAEITNTTINGGAEIVLNADVLDFNGNADISGTLAVGGAATFSNNVTVGGTLSGNGSGLTNLNASNLSSGTVADARLSSNVPLKNASNTFTGNIPIIARSGAPRFVSFVDGQPEDQGGWLYGGSAQGGNFRFLIATTADSEPSAAVNEAFVIRRNGTDVTEVELNATTLDFNGNADISGTLEVGGAARAGTAATSTSSTLAAGQIHHRSSNTTVPSMSAGQWVAVQNTSTSSITLSQGSGVTLELGGTTMTGNRTLLPKGFAFIYFRANGVGVVHGSGVT